MTLFGPRSSVRIFVIVFSPNTKRNTVRRFFRAIIRHDYHYLYRFHGNLIVFWRRMEK